MRTTVRLDPQLLAQLKKVAADSGRSLNEVISDAIRESLSRRSDAHRPRRVRVPTFTGDGVRPGVDLNDSAALLALLEQERDEKIGASIRRQRPRVRPSRRSG